MQFDDNEIVLQKTAIQKDSGQHQPYTWEVIQATVLSR